MPFRPENNAHCVTANYSLNTDGSIKVINSKKVGSKQGELVQKEGKAWSVDATNSKLKVQF